MSHPRPEPRRAKRSAGRQIPYLWLLTGLITIAVIGFLVYATRPEPAVEAGEIPCSSQEHFTYHVHTNLRIYINGELEPVPANVGIRPGVCLFWLHTHDSSGTIHVEAPEERSFTLGQFFQIWGRPLSSTQLLDHQVDDEHQIQAYVNGEEWTGDPAEIPLESRASVTLMYGPPFAEPHTHIFAPNE